MSSSSSNDNDYLLHRAVVALQVAWRRSHECLGQCPSTLLFGNRRRTGRFLVALLVSLGHFHILYQQVHLRHKQAALVVQKCYRGHASRRRHAQEHAHVLHVRASLLLQKILNQRFAVLQRKWKRRRFLLLKLQRAVRRHWLGPRASAATCLQALVRRKLEEGRYYKLCRAGIVVQKWYRGVLQRRQAATRLQAWVRAHQARVRYQQAILSVLRIQALARRFQAKNRYHHTRACVVRLQARVRLRLAMTEYQRAIRVSILLQAHARERQAQRRWQRERSLVTHCQAGVRRRQARSAYQRQRAAMTQFQAAVRRRQVQSMFRRVRISIIFIQAVWRRYLKQEAYLRAQRACIRIQANARTWQQSRRYHQTHQSILRLQTTVRWYLQEHHYTKQRVAATKCQAALRQCRAHRSYHRARQATARLQSGGRMFLERHRFRKTKSAAIQCQAMARGYLERRRRIEALPKHDQTPSHDVSPFSNTTQSLEEYVQQLEDEMGILVTPSPARRTRHDSDDDGVREEMERLSAIRSSLRHELQRCHAIVDDNRDSPASGVSDEATYMHPVPDDRVVTPEPTTLSRPSLNSFNTSSSSSRTLSNRRQPQLRRKVEASPAVVTAEECQVDHRQSLVREQQHDEASVVIQKTVRARYEQRVFQRQRQAAVLIQGRVRIMLRHAALARSRVHIGKRRKALLQSQERLSQRYLELLMRFEPEALLIQTVVRRYLARRQRQLKYDQMLTALDGLVRHRRSSLRAGQNLNLANDLNKFEGALDSMLKGPNSPIQSPRTTKKKIVVEKSPAAVMDIIDMQDVADYNEESSSSEEETLFTTLVGAYEEEYFSEDNNRSSEDESDDDNDVFSVSSSSEEDGEPVRRQLLSDLPMISIAEGRSDMTELSTHLDPVMTESTSPQSSGEKTSLLNAPEKKTRFGLPALAGTVVLLLLAIFSTSAQTVSLCAPVRPGTKLVPNHVYAAPWWGPSWMCGAARRVTLHVETHKRRARHSVVYDATALYQAPKGHAIAAAVVQADGSLAVTLTKQPRWWRRNRQNRTETVRVTI